jgi:GMP synthase-like glutamine amidotransferase
MRIHCLEHQPAEGPGKIAGWAAARGHPLARTALHAGEPPPPVGAFDFLLIMGGGMNIHQHRDHPWLVREKEFLARVVHETDRPVLGICLGAQLLADVLGGKVFQNAEKEIGWWPVAFTDRRAPFAGFPPALTVMHWHGDTYTLPPGARCVASSPGCAQQAFVWGGRVVGLQFHLEMGAVHVADLAHVAAADLTPGRWVQSAAQLTQTPPGLPATQAALFTLLDALAAPPGRVGIPLG